MNFLFGLGSEFVVLVLDGFVGQLSKLIGELLWIGLGASAKWGILQLGKGSKRGSLLLLYRIVSG